MLCKHYGLMDHPVIGLIKECEGFSPVPYLCPASYWTIGWGHLCDRDHPPITEDEGNAYLEQDLDIALTGVLRRAPLIAGEPVQRMAALVSWTFNLGEENLRTSTMLKRILERDWEAAAKEMLRWNKATVNGVKQVLRGLVVRREKEARLFLTGTF